MRAEAFHPDLRRLAPWLPRRPVGPRLLSPARWAFAAFARRLAVPGVVVETVGPVTVRVHRPPHAPSTAPALLWIHGGGYVMGGAVQDDRLCRRIARALGILVAAVDYRLAPEHPYPVPLEDCDRVLGWLAARPDVEPGRLAVGGASAGGGLAAAVSILAHQRGGPEVVLQMLAYPMLDDRTAQREGVDQRHFRLWDNRANRFGWSAYTGRAPGGPDVSPLAAPGRQADLSGLPAAWIGVGTRDLFHEEDVAYADRLVSSGVPCTLEVVEGAYHGFDAVQPRAGVSRAFRSAQIAALAEALGCSNREAEG